MCFVPPESYECGDGHTIYVLRDYVNAWGNPASEMTQCEDPIHEEECPEGWRCIVDTPTGFKYGSCTLRP